MNLESLIITPDMLNIVVEIVKFNEQWKYKENPTTAVTQTLKKVATIESIGSSTRIEGSKLSNDEVAGFIVNLKEKSFKTRDQQEVAGYAEVMELVYLSFEELTLTENHVKQLH